MKNIIKYLTFLLVLFAMFGLVLAQAQKGPAKWKNADPIELKGKVTNILKPFATMESGDKTYKVHLGPVWYWDQEKLELKTGKTEIVGKMEELNGEFHVYPSSIKQGSVEIILTDNNELPKWMGEGKAHKTNAMGKGKCKGKQKGYGKCQKKCCGNCVNCKKNNNN